MFARTCLLILVCGYCGRTGLAAEASRSLLELRLHGARVEGMALAWSPERVFLLGRDGRLWEFPPREAEDYHKVPGLFIGYSANVMRGLVERELGRGYEVSGVGRYLVAHPVGQKSLWAERFEDLYRSFVHYFAVRGFKLKQPEFPLVAIVLPNQQAFQHYAMKEGRRLSQGVLGYYSPTTNRIALFDTAQSSDWTLNAETIIHEATHQTAFNTGIHSRFADQPRWAVEGLAMLFEAAGVWNSRLHPQAKDRVNRHQLASFRKFQSGSRQKDSLVELIRSDKRFDNRPLDAYAESWAFSFFLVETEPRKYASYLQKLSALPEFAVRRPEERLADFEQVFGKNFAILESRFSRYIAELK